MRKLGPETARSHQSRIASKFYEKYMSGKGLDIGYRGDGEENKDTQPVLDSATGIDLDYPGYDGLYLPFDDESQDYIFSSHCLEHMSDPYKVIKEWYRVLKIGGHMVITVPHQFLYERKLKLPSKWNGGHRRFYKTSDLLMEIEGALPVNGYRIVHLRENDYGFDYNVPPTEHAVGAYEIECVIKKLPKWKYELL